MVIFPCHLQGKIGKKTTVEDVKDDVYELLDSDFAKSSEIILDEINNWKEDILPSSKCVDLIRTIGGGFHSEELAVHMWKVDPNESGSLERFYI